MTIYRFADPASFQWLWTLPVLFVLAMWFWRRRKRVMEKAFGSKIFGFLSSSVSIGKKRWKLGLELAVLALMVVALARPQSGQSQKKVRSEGIELMVLFDVSRSMLAEDVKPSRMELAKKELERLFDLGGGDKVGLIAFAGSAVLLSPMTPDRGALKMYIDSLSPEAVSTQGTEFRDALMEAKAAFDRGGVEPDAQTSVARAVVIVSDGEDNEPGAIEAAKELKNDGIRIFSLGFGSEKGGPIPVRDDRGRLVGYRKDKGGKVIMTKTEGKILKELARVGDGSFYHVTLGGTGIRNLRNDLDALEQAEFESAEVTDYDEKFQWFLGLALILALIELALGERRNSGRLWKGRFEVAEQ